MALHKKQSEDKFWLYCVTIGKNLFDGALVASTGRTPYCQSVEDYEKLLPWNINKEELLKAA